MISPKDQNLSVSTLKTRGRAGKSPVN